VDDDARVLAARLGCSTEAVQLTRAVDVVDLHLDTFIPPRLWGYDVMARHGGGPLGRRFFGHVDVPRLRDGGLAGAMWSITTNPLHGAAARWRVFCANLARLRATIAASGGALAMARTLSEYRAARATGAHVCLPSIQGGNALDAAPDGPASIPDDAIVRVTLVHLTNAVYGGTSSPLGRLRPDPGLTARGRELVAQLNARRIFVDLAHIHERAFFDAVAVHDRTQPLLVTHTGVRGVRSMWRNLTDAQLRAVADTGGTVGIIFAEPFLKRPGGPRDAGMVVEHIAHVVDTVGDAHVSIGSDFDGAITPPPDLHGADCYPRLVQHMLDRGWSDERIARIVGGNALRVLGALRP
jgi:membrane dipeptidase